MYVSSVQYCKYRPFVGCGGVGWDKREGGWEEEGQIQLNLLSRSPCQQPPLLSCDFQYCRWQWSCDCADVTAREGVSIPAECSVCCEPLSSTHSGRTPAHTVSPINTQPLTFLSLPLSLTFEHLTPSSVSLR